MLVTLGRKTLNFDHVVKVEPVDGQPDTLAVLTTDGDYETFTGDEAARLELVLGIYAVDATHARTVGEAIDVEAEKAAERANVRDGLVPPPGREQLGEGGPDVGAEVDRAVTGLVDPAATIAAYQTYHAEVTAAVNGDPDPAPLIGQANRRLAEALAHAAPA